MTNMRRLLDLKQSVWLDYLSRGMTRSGELHAMIADGLRGMTSNPTIFEHAIGHTSDYDQPFVCSRITTGCGGRLAKTPRRRQKAPGASRGVGLARHSRRAFTC